MGLSGRSALVSRARPSVVSQGNHAGLVQPHLNTGLGQMILQSLILAWGQHQTPPGLSSSPFWMIRASGQ